MEQFNVENWLDQLNEQQLNIVLIITILFLFYMYFGFPWYICKYKKYDFEIQKAQRVSRIIWIIVDIAYVTDFEGKIDYEKIRLHIIEFMNEKILVEDKDIFSIVIRTQVYKESSTGLKISIISSIFSESCGTDLSGSYFDTYPLRVGFVKFDREMKEAKKTLSDDELLDLGLLKYKLQLKERSDAR